MAHTAHHRANNERFFLLVDEFDPHEPFDTPEPWASMYGASWQGPKSYATMLPRPRLVISVN